MSEDWRGDSKESRDTNQRHVTRDTKQRRDSDDERLRAEPGEQLGPGVG